RLRQVGVDRAQDEKLNARISVARPVVFGRVLLRGGLDLALDRYDVTPFDKPYSERHPLCETVSTMELDELLKERPDQAELEAAGCSAMGKTLDEQIKALKEQREALGDRDKLEESFRTLFPSRLDLALGGWVDALVVLDQRSTLNPGLRVDHYTSLGNTALAV